LKQFAYTLRTYKRAKHIRITIRANGTVLVTKPTYVSVSKTREFVESKSDWIQTELARQEKSTGFLLHTYTQEHFEKNKEKALLLIKGKVERLNREYGFSFNSVKVKRMTSRWGSCSIKQNLNFNYALIFLREELIDYVVVHELCHLKEFNHSENFWKLVEKMIPNYKEIKKELSQLK